MSKLNQRNTPIGDVVILFIPFIIHILNREKKLGKSTLNWNKIQFQFINKITFSLITILKPFTSVQGAYFMNFLLESLQIRIS